MKRLMWLALAAWLPASGLPARTPAARLAPRAREGSQADPPARVPGALDLTDEPQAATAAAVAPPAPEPGLPSAADPGAEQAAAIPDKALAAYFGARPQTYLIDPQKLLDLPTTQEQSAFLASHADDSTIDLFIYLFKRDQEIPGDVREDELVERFFASGRPAMIVCYFLGAPQRAVLSLSPSLTDAVSATEQRRTLQSAVKQAMEKTSPQDQLQAFSGHLATRICLMESLLSDADADSAEQKAAQARAAKLGKRSTSLAERWEKLRPTAEAFAVPGLLLASLLAAAAGLVTWLRWRATYRFPEFAVEPRLGGQHGAGVGAVISFANAGLSPAAQRAQVSDCVRRG